MKDKLLDRFRSLFWDAFHVPDLQTDKFKQVWEQLEPLNDQVAGPLFSVFEKGNCDYIFEDNERFASVNTPEDLFERLVDINKQYAEKAASIPAETDEEKKDLQTLLYQADIKMELSELAVQILQADH